MVIAWKATTGHVDKYLFVRNHCHNMLKLNRRCEGVTSADGALSDRYSSVINFLLFSFPVVICTVKPLGEVILLVLAIIGIFLSISRKTMPFNVKALRLFSGLTLGYFGIVLLSIIFSDDPLGSIHFISREQHFLLAPFVALAVLNARWSLNHLLLGIKIGLMVMGCIALYKYLNGVERNFGGVNAVLFGDLAVMMLFLSIVRIFEESNGQRLFTVLALLMGLVAILLSGTRGAWLSFIILTPLYLWLVCWRYMVGNYKAGLLALVAVIVIGVAAVSSNIMQERISTAVKEIKLWSTDENINSSVGIRLEMWSAALQAAKEMPWSGYGYRNVTVVVAEYAGEEAQVQIRGFKHLHNEYLTSLLGTGVLGLLSVLLLLFVPLLMFLKSRKKEDMFPFAAMGAMLSVGYASFGLTNLSFGESFMNSFYVVFLALLLTMVMRGHAR